jgi:hypothetical protein
MRGETTAVAPAMVEAMKKDSDKIVRVFITHALADSLGDGRSGDIEFPVARSGV